MPKNINNFESEMNKVLNAAERGMTKACLQLQGDTMDLTHTKTGALRRSWTYTVESNDGIIEGAVGSNIPYAIYEDDYHGNLSRAINSNLDTYFQTVVKELKTVGG